MLYASRCVSMQQTAVAHPAGLRALSQLAIVELLVDALAMPGKRTFALVAAASEKAAVFHMANQEGGEEQKEDASRAATTSSTSNLPTCDNLAAAGGSKGPPSLVSLLVESASSGKEAPSSSSSSSLELALHLTSSEAEALHRLERWRRTVALMRHAIEANPSEDAHALELASKYGTHYASTSNGLQSQQHDQSASTSTSTRPLPMGAKSPGAGRAMGAGEAFDAAFLSSSRNSSSSSSSSRGKPQIGVMDRIFAQLASCIPYLSAPSKNTTTAATATNGVLPSDALFLKLDEVCVSSFALHALVLCAALVARQGGASLGLRQGHVALGTLHSFQLLTPPKLPGKSTSTRALESVEGAHLTPNDALVNEEGVQMEGRTCLPWLAKDVSASLSDALAGAPELLLFELVRSLLEKTNALAQAWVQGGGAQKAEALHLDYGATLPTSSASPEAASSSTVVEEAPLLSNDFVSNLPKCLARCKELLIAVAKSGSVNGGNGGGLGNVPPAVTAMLLQVVATGFVGAFKEEGNTGQDEDGGEGEETPKVLRQRCLALAVGLVNQLADAKAQARTIAADPLIGRALSRALLASLPSVARCPSPTLDGEEGGGNDAAESKQQAAAAAAAAQAAAAAEAAAAAAEAAAATQMSRAAADEDAYMQPVKWACVACTFGNEKPFSAAPEAVYCCEMCETPYEPPKRTPPMAAVAAQLVKPKPPPPPPQTKVPSFSQPKTKAASKVPLDEAMSQLPSTLQGEWFVQHLLKPVSELCGKLQPYRSFLDSALFQDFLDDEDNENDANSMPSARAAASAGVDGVSEALVVQTVHGDPSGTVHVKLPLTPQDLSSSSPSSSSSAAASSTKSLSAPMCCLMDVLTLSVRAVPEARKHAACVAVVLKLMAASSSSSALPQVKSGLGEMGLSSGNVLQGGGSHKGGKGGGHRLAEAYARAMRADAGETEWRPSHGGAALVSTSASSLQPPPPSADDAWLEAPLDLALTGLRLLNSSTPSSSSAPSSSNRHRSMSVTARASIGQPPPGSLVVAAVATAAPVMMAATTATAVSSAAGSHTNADVDANQAPLSLIDQIALRVTLLRGVIDVCLVAQHQAKTMRSAKKTSALRESLSALLFADQATTKTMVDTVLAGAAAPRTLQVNKMEHEREQQQQQEEEEQQLRSTTSAETTWWRQKTPAHSNNISSSSSGALGGAIAQSEVAAAAGAARSALEIALGLMELADHLSHSDACIAIMLFGPQSKKGNDSSGSSSLPPARKGFVELVLRLLNAGGLSRIGGGDEQRRLNLSGLRALDHVATIEDEDMDAAATELLLQMHAPRAVLTVLQQGDSGRGGHGALALVSLDVQEAAVEALASLAYSSAAASELVEQGAVSLLVNIATSYDEAHALVLRCAQTLALLLRDDATAAVRETPNRASVVSSLSSRRVSSGGNQGVARTGALYSFAESGGVQFFLQLLRSVALDEREAQKGSGASTKGGPRGGDELRATALTLLGSLARSQAVTAELSQEARAVPSILAFLTKALAGDERRGAGGGAGGDEDDDEESTRALEQSVDALTHLADYPSLNEQIGEHGMHLLLQLLGTALGDRRLSLLYLDLIKHLTVHDLNVKALVANDGIPLLLWLLEFAHDNSNKSATSSRRAQEIHPAEAEQLVVKLELLILASLGNMVAASVEYAAVMEAAGCVRVLESCATKAAERDNYEVRAKALEVQQQLSRVDLTGLKSKMRGSVITAGGHRSSTSMSAAPQNSLSSGAGERGGGGAGPVQASTSSSSTNTSKPKPPPPPSPPPPGSLNSKPPPPQGARPPPPTSSSPPSSSGSMPTTSRHEQAAARPPPPPLAGVAALGGTSDYGAEGALPVTRLRNSSQAAATQVAPAARMGYLRKQGAGTSMLGRKSWKTRFFYLDGACLSYFDNEDSRDKPLNAQPFVLPFCDVLLDNSTSAVGEGKFRFTIKPCGSRGGKAPLLLEADSNGQRTQWVEWLNLAQKMRAPPP